MKDMAYTPAELAEKQKEYGGSMEVGNMPKYPWGLGLNLSDEVMSKLGLGTLTVGDEVIIVAKAKVTGMSAREEVDGDVKNCSDLQIIAMDVKTGVDLSKAPDVLFNKG